MSKWSQNQFVALWCSSYCHPGQNCQGNSNISGNCQAIWTDSNCLGENLWKNWILLVYITASVPQNMYLSIFCCFDIAITSWMSLANFGTKLDRFVEKTTHVAKHCKVAPCRKGRNQHTLYYCYCFYFMSKWSKYTYSIWLTMWFLIQSLRIKAQFDLQFELQQNSN